MVIAFKAKQTAISKTVPSLRAAARSLSVVEGQPVYSLLSQTTNNNGSALTTKESKHQTNLGRFSQQQTLYIKQIFLPKLYTYVNKYHYLYTV